VLSDELAPIHTLPPMSAEFLKGSCGGAMQHSKVCADRTHGLAVLVGRILRFGAGVKS